MKTIIAVLITAVVIPASAFAGATWQREHNGIICKSLSGGIGCVKSDGTGYGVAIHRDFVFVMKSGGQRVFLRYQP